MSNDLMQEAIDVLRDHPEIQCTGSLKQGDFMCAEGPFAQQLVNHFPERFSWVSNGQGSQFRLRDQEMLSFSGNPLSFHALTPDHWNLLHPNGNRIATMVAAAFGHNNVATANDQSNIPFSSFARKFQQIKDKVGMAQRCDRCGQEFVPFPDRSRLCMSCDHIEHRNKSVIEGDLSAQSY